MLNWSLYGDTAAHDRLAADATSGGTRWEADLASYPTSVISLRSWANNQYVSAPNGGADPLVANRTSIGSGESFDLING